LRLGAETCVDLARSFVGIAVKAGRAHPDIATEPQTSAVFSAGRPAASSKVARSDALLTYLASSEVASVLRASELEP
jgi:molybdate transport system substrate-binding protein